MAAFLTTDLAATGLEALVTVGFAATAFFAALGATVLDATALAAGFLASAFGVVVTAAFAGLFLTAFAVGAGVALVAFFAALPPKIPFQPSEYFSFVPTRVIVTESPLTETENI